MRALDAKVTIDDSALFRHPDLAVLRDTAAADPLEAFARERGVIYVKLDGSVGILGNGAGLSMATVDVVVVAGGRPANFCDLGGGGSAEGVVDALEVIARDPQVRSILFNIFGGITRCDEVARGILDRARAASTSRVPIVVRLDGTNAEEGRRILAEAAKPGVHVEPTMLDAAQLAPWSWRHERALERARRALPHERRRTARGPISTSSSSGRRAAATAIDVATGGGHVARRLREAGLEVVSCDPSPGMQPDVICFAEELPFADSSFDLAVTRVAAHHFADVAQATRELGRVASAARRRRRHPLHGRGRRARPRSSATPRTSATTPRRSGAGSSPERGSRSRRCAIFDYPIELEPWLERTGCTGETADARARAARRPDRRRRASSLDRIALRGKPA